MEPVFFVQGHPTLEAFEEYAFNRLSEADTETLEEHLLICATCQASLAEVDEYIALMREATGTCETAAGQSEKPVAGGKNKLSAMGVGYAGTAVVLAGLTFMALVARRPGGSSTSAAEAGPVSLIALRGGEPLNHARAGKPLQLDLDSTGLEARATAYHVEVVNAAGKPVWTGAIADCREENAQAACGSAKALAPVRIASGLNAGMYWVRISANGQLLREFGLVADN